MSDNQFLAWHATADGGTTPIPQYTYMDMASTGKLSAATAAAKGFGFIQDYVSRDDYTVSVRLSGETFAIAGAVIAIGAELMIGTSGKVITQVATNIWTAEMDSTNALSDVTFTGLLEGDANSAINVGFIDPSGTSQPLTIVVEGTEIKVLLATDGGDAISSTAALIKAALDGDTQASALVSTAVEGAGSGIVEAIDYTFLTATTTDGVAVARALEAAAADEDVIRVWAYN